MSLRVIVDGHRARVELKDPALPVCNTPIPSKREVLEALAVIEGLAKHSGHTCPKSFALLRTYILTR